MTKKGLENRGITERHMSLCLLLIHEFIEPCSKCIVSLLIRFTSRFYQLIDFILLQKCQMICFLIFSILTEIFAFFEVLKQLVFLVLNKMSMFVANFNP